MFDVEETPEPDIQTARAKRDNIQGGQRLALCSDYIKFSCKDKCYLSRVEYAVLSSQNI